MSSHLQNLVGLVKAGVLIGVYCKIVGLIERTGHLIGYSCSLLLVIKILRIVKWRFPADTRQHRYISPSL